MPGYQVVQFLGTGARSTIWQLRETRTGKLAALKRTVKRESNDYRYLEQAVREYEVGRQLDHPVIRKVYQLRKVRWFFSLREVRVLMEYCEGKTIQEKRPETVLETVRIFREVAEGMAYMNARGFVHADLKPNNIVVATTGGVKIIDFGQSCTVGTVKERIQGTPDYIAPEQVHRRPLDARTDVFNFGATLYWTLTGRPIPTVLPEQNSVLPAQNLVATPADQLNPDVPLGLAKLVTDCIEPKPADRPAGMAEVASRLDLILHTLERPARPENP